MKWKTIKGIKMNESILLKGRKEVTKQFMITWLMAKELERHNLNFADICRKALANEILKRTSTLKKDNGENTILVEGGINV